MSQNSKAEKVLDVALELLKANGDYGVTMRQVASHANMSLSNVQYYFKNKDELLKAMASRYFGACLEEMRGMKVIQYSGPIETEINDLLKGFLSHGLEVSEMYRIFREYWAISTRNVVIDTHVKEYYREMVVILSNILRPAAESEQALAETVSIIIPFVEGYSITALAMPNEFDGVTENLTNFVVALLEGKSNM
jgi:AcrR family transcriptional regulator